MRTCCYADEFANTLNTEHERKEFVIRKQLFYIGGLGEDIVKNNALHVLQGFQSYSKRFHEDCCVGRANTRQAAR